MALANNWIGYIDRSYEQIKSAILSRLPLTTPEITDHTEGNVLVRLISIWAGISEQFNYFIDSIAREIYLPTALEFSTGVYHAITADYRIKSSIAATVDVTILFNSAVGSSFTIAKNSLLQTRDGIIFRTVANVAVASGATSAILPCENSIEIVGETLGTSTGLPNQIFVLDEDIVDGQAEVTVNGTVYTFISSFVYAQSTDYVFSMNVNADGKTYIIFGDGVNGVIPTVGASVVISYSITSGSLGNVGAGTITQITSLTLPVGVTGTVNNPAAAGGGYDVESLKDLQKHIPLSLRTLDRAVTGQDYVDIALQCNGVAQASVVFNCGKVVYIYVVGNGGVSASSLLLQRVKNWFEDKRMVTTLIEPRAAGILDVVVYATIVAKKNFQNNTVSTNVTNALVDRYSIDNQVIKGSLYLGDLYQTMENAEGVERTELTRLTFRPAAIPRNSATALVWTAEMLDASLSTISWSIKVVSTTQYELYRGATFVGTQNFGTLYTLTEISLNVTYNGSYSVSDIWDFKTYKIGGSLSLDELSVPIIHSENVILNVTGGI